MRSIEIIKNALTEIHDCVSGSEAPPKEKVPYIVWAEDGANHFQADGKNLETAFSGTIDLFTRDEDDRIARENSGSAE